MTRVKFRGTLVAREPAEFCTYAQIQMHQNRRFKNVPFLGDVVSLVYFSTHPQPLLIEGIKKTWMRISAHSGH